jgi:pimeloyl-ACP methyl ester carboxylesterase
VSGGLLPTTAVTVEGRAVRVARAGPPGDPLVFLHGYPDNLQLWSRCAHRLAAAKRAVLALDWPGMGDSEAWPGGATPGHMADRLAAVLDACGVWSATLVAHDMGAPPALVFASRHPERVRGLVVLNSLVAADGPTSWEIAVLRRFAWNRWLLRRAPRVVFERAVRSSLPPGAGLTDAVRDDLWRCFRRPEVRAFVSKMCAAYQGTLPALAEALPKIQAPVRLLWGARDHHFPPAQGRWLADRVSGATLEIVPGGAHWMAWQDADSVAERIESFAGGPG